MTTVGVSEKAGLVGGFNDCKAENVLVIKIGSVNVVTVRRFITGSMSTTSGETTIVLLPWRKSQKVG